MATKDFFVDGKSKSFDISKSNQDAQYRNLNLNSHLKFSETDHALSKRLSKGKNITNFIDHSSFESQTKSDLKFGGDENSSKASKLSTFYNCDEKANQKRWQKAENVSSANILNPNETKSGNKKSKFAFWKKSNQKEDDYKGLKQVKTPMKAYLKERFTIWFDSFRSLQEEKQIHEKPLQLGIAHTDWHQQDNNDTEGDADSEYEIDQRNYGDNLASLISDPTNQQQQQFVTTPASYDSETALPAFEGAGTEPNTAILVPTEIWSLFVPAPRPQ
uniref:Uncharacterized protein n=1 Tax=Panagrolaimus sp. ES5 TaxID=591445 RepID=A0AC34F7L7_9BILA